MSFIEIISKVNIDENEYSSFYKKTFATPIKKFFNLLRSDNKFVGNVAIWSFLNNEVLIPKPFGNVENIKNFDISKQIESFSFTKYFIINSIKDVLYFKKEDDIVSYKFKNEIKKIIDDNIEKLLEVLSIKEGDKENATKTFNASIKNFLQKEEIEFIYFIPIIIDLTVVGIFAYNSNKEIEDDFLNYVLKPYISGIIAPPHYQEFKFIKRFYALKSALSAIMSRNMSHNIGSHVLSYASTNLNHPEDMRVLTEYLQERMDFIAQITSKIPEWSMPMRFEGQLMQNFYKQRILLNYIAFSEGLTAFEKDDKDNVENKLKINISNFKEDKNKKIINNEKDPLIAIPGGITGTHAFYTIIENIIRNAAKHSYNKKDNKQNKGLEVYIQIIDKEEDNKDFTILQLKYMIMLLFIQKNYSIL